MSRSCDHPAHPATEATGGLPAARQRRDETPGRRPGRALVVDDSRSMRRIITGMLHPLGVATEEAGDGAEALAVLASEGPDAFDLVTIDWHMPVMDGLALVGAIRQGRGWRGLTLLMVTSEREESQVVRALAAGAHEYLTKPFTAEDLHAKLQLLGVTR